MRVAEPVNHPISLRALISYKPPLAPCSPKGVFFLYPDLRSGRESRIIKWAKASIRIPDENLQNRALVMGIVYELLD